MGVLPHAPLVGRADELAALRRAVTTSWEGRTTTVVLRGEAGIGKTRLVSELVTAIPESRCRVVTGACSAIAGQQLPWAPWLDIVRDVRRCYDDETVSGLLNGRLTALAPLAPGLTADRSTTPRPRAELFGAVADLITGVAARRPVLLVLEDVQWADEDSLALLLHLTRASRTDPLAVVVTARTEDPAYERVRQRLGELERSPGSVRIDLDALSALEVVAQSEHLAGHALDPSVMSRIIDLSGGIPLFVEELVAAARRDGTTITPQPMQERLLGLSPAARMVVDELALCVAEPPPTVLLRASGLTDHEFDAALAEGRAAGVLVTADGRPRFRHALLREATAQLLLPRRTRELHEALAQAWSAASPAEPERCLEQAVATAHHWGEAEDPAAALTASVHAADLARRGSAYATRGELLQDAARLWHQVPDAPERAGRDRAALLTEAAEAAAAAYADPGRALDLLAQARESLVEEPPQEDRSARLAWLEVLETEYRKRAAERRSADEIVAGLAAIPREPATREWVRAASRAVLALQQAGRPEDGAPYAQEAVDAARRLGDPALESDATTMLAFSELHLGRRAEALRLARASIRLAERTRDLKALHDALMGLAMVFWYLGELQGAGEVTRQDLELLGGREPGPLPSAWGMQTTNLAELCMDLGDWDEADRLLSSVLGRDDMPPMVCGFAERLRRHLGTWRGDDRRDSGCGDLHGGLDRADVQDLVPTRYTLADIATSHGDLTRVRSFVHDVLADPRTASHAPVVLALLEVATRAEADWARSVGRTRTRPPAPGRSTVSATSSPSCRPTTPATGPTSPTSRPSWPGGTATTTPRHGPRSCSVGVRR